MSDRFEAITNCPRCGTVAVHRLRAPRPSADAEPYVPEFQRIVTFGGETVRTIETTRPPLREGDYEIIRTCKCGHEWGQR